MEEASSSSMRVVEPSLSNALPHFAPLFVFPLVVVAALKGGWWIAAPIVFFMLADHFDRLFGIEERNMDPATTAESQLFLYKLSLWLWAVLWPVVFVFAILQMAAGHLSLWEIGLVVVVVAMVAQSVFVVGHELVHRRALWERRLGEFLLASVSYPHYATEHVYIHHPRVCTPLDPGSAPKGLGFWQYLPREVANNLLGAWRFERRRLARRRLPMWHYTNAFWRYAVELAFWYGLIYAITGWVGVVAFVVLCGSVVFSMKISNYVQHYGLRRIRMPHGRFEPVKPRHAWSAAYKFTNWLYYNMQRHADHHTSNRRYPLLQHYGEADSPQLPSSYIQMNGLALFPKRWFELVDPLVDRQRAQFYPEVDAWSAYDSKAFAARPDAFDAIAEIHASSPMLAGWIDETPELLDVLRDREFTDLELPEGVGLDPEAEDIARRGLARLYWTRELGPSEMMEQLDDIHTQDAGEAVDAAREWSNGKVFQICMHSIRDSLTADETGLALSRVAEASIAKVLAAVEEDLEDRGVPSGEWRSGSGRVGTARQGERDSGHEARHRLRPPRYRGPVSWIADPPLPERHQGALPPQPAARSGSPSGAALARCSRWLRSRRGSGALGSDNGGAELKEARCVFASGDPGVRHRFESLLRDGSGRHAANGVHAGAPPAGEHEPTGGR